jgi:hypothetical protein
MKRGRGIKDLDDQSRAKFMEILMTERVVYYESIKREPKIRGIKKCRCDERLQTKTKEFTRLPYTGFKHCFCFFVKKKAY